MRIGIDNSNGAMCDRCGKCMLPKEIVKLHSSQLSPEPDKASTGCSVTVGRCDLCIDCYDQLNKIFVSMRMPRKAKKGANG